MAHDAPYVDLVESSIGTLAWAAAVPTTKSVADFSAERTAADAVEHPCPATLEIEQPITVGGDPGLLTLKHCPESDGILVANTAVIHRGTGYFFYFQDPTYAAPDKDDLAVFKTLLSAVEFL